MYVRGGRIKVSYTCTYKHIERNSMAREGKERERRREGEGRREGKHGGEYGVIRGLSAREMVNGCDDVHTSTRKQQSISVDLMPVNNAMTCLLLTA